MVRACGKNGCQRGLCAAIQEILVRNRRSGALLEEFSLSVFSLLHWTLQL